MLTDLIIYSFRNLRNKTLRTWLTMLGIVIGIASVIALIGLGGGLHAAIFGQFGSISADILTIQAGGIAFAGPPGSAVANPLKKKYVKDIEKINNIEFSISRVLESGTLEFNNIQSIGLAVSMPYGEARKEIHQIFGLDSYSGRLLKDSDQNKVVLGYNFGKEDSKIFNKPVRAGDRVKLIGKTFEVVGIMASQGNFMFDGAVLVNEDVLRELTGNKDDANIIVAKVKSLSQIDTAKNAIEKYLRKERNVKKGEEDFTVESAKATIDTINKVLGGVQAFVIIIAAISMIVGAIGIINTMFTSVLERRKEIGIMKAIGAKNEDIFALFFIESGLLGTVGGAIGIIIGYIAAKAGTIALSSALNIVVSPDISLLLILGSLFGSFLIGAVSGIIPAMQAAKMHPVDALRSK